VPPGPEPGGSRGAGLRDACLCLLGAIGWFYIKTGFGADALSDAITAEGLDRLPAVLSIFFLAVVVAPICEELVFRGFLFGFLRSRCGAPLAALASSALFAVLHGYSGTGLALVFVFGLVFAWIYQRSGSLLPGIVAHAAFNFVVTFQVVGWFSLH